MAQRNDHDVANTLATKAGELLIELREKLTNTNITGSELAEVGDQKSHVLLMNLLAQICPEDAILSEEAEDDSGRLSAERVWIIDPLDGSREFGEPPRTDWAVHVALVEKSSPTAGAVAVPGAGFTLSTGTRLVVPPQPPGPPRVICSRSRPGPAAEVLREALGSELILMGSAGAKTMAVVRGEADIYAHTGGQFEWDSCAPVAVAEAAGLHASRLDGSPLRYNQADPYLPDLLICRRELAPRVVDALAGTV